MSSATAPTWEALSRPAVGLHARRHPESERVWLAVDATDRRHLLVRATGEAAGQELLSTKGLQARTATLTLEGAGTDLWVDIECSNPALNDVFLVVAADLVSAINAPGAQAYPATIRTLATWQWFWSVDPGALTDESALGLFGELWFLSQWCKLPEAAVSWVGPLANRHDLVSPHISVEVKTSRSSSGGAGRHRIASLEQLADPATGELYLFSVQVVVDPNAGNRLSSLVQQVTLALLPRPDLLVDFERRLAIAGWSPAFASRFDTTYRVVQETLYLVGDSFPRLTSATFAGGLPVGVEQVGYTLDLAACGEWVLAVRPEDCTELLARLGDAS